MTNGWNFWRLWIVACLLIDAVLKYSSSILSVICLTLSAILSFYLHDAIPARCLSQIPVTGICKPVLCRNGWADQAFFRVYWRFILQCIKGFGYFRKLLSNSGLRKVLSRHVDSCKFFLAQFNWRPSPVYRTETSVCKLNLKYLHTSPKCRNWSCGPDHAQSSLDFTQPTSTRNLNFLALAIPEIFQGV